MSSFNPQMRIIQKEKIMIRKYGNKEKYFRVHVIRIRNSKSNVPKFNKNQLQIA